MGPISPNYSRFLLATTLFLCASFIVLLDGMLLNLSAAEFGVELAPDFEVTSFQGEYFSRFNFEGEQALLMFWAPWCGVCRQELPKLARYYQNDLPYGLQVLAIGTAASLGEVEQYVNSHPGTFTFPTAYDADKVIAGDFRIRAYPTSVLIDRDGSIVLVHRGSGLLNNREFHELVE